MREQGRVGLSTCCRASDPVCSRKAAVSGTEGSNSHEVSIPYRQATISTALTAGSTSARTSVDKVLLATAEQQLYDTARDLLPGAVELTETPWRSEYLYSRAATIYGGTAEIQRNIIARRLLSLGRD